VWGHPNVQGTFVPKNFTGAAACLKARDPNLDERTRDLAHDLQSALRLTVGFSDIYLNCSKFGISVKEIFHLNSKLKLNQQEVIYLSLFPFKMLFYS